MAKPPEPTLSPVRSAQKSVLKRMGQISSAVAEGAKTATGHVAQRLTKLDGTAHITERFSNLGKGIAAKAADLDGRFEVSTKAAQLGGAVSTKASLLGGAVAREANAAVASVKRAADDRGITETLERRVAEPAREMGRAISESEALKSGLATAERAYGAVRNAAKDVVNPYFATNDARALKSLGYNEDS